METTQTQQPTLKVVSGARTTPAQTTETITQNNGGNLIATQQHAPVTKLGTQVAKPVETTTTEEFIFNPDIDKVETIVVDDKGTVTEPTETKFNYSRFKPFVGKDEFGEDDLFNAFTERENKIKERETKLAVLKEGKERLAKDEQYQDWNKFLKTNDQDLVTASLAYEYAQDGLGAKEAMDKAKARVEDEIKRNPNYLEDSSRVIRRGLKQSIQEKEIAIQSEIENASKDINFVNNEVEFENKVKEAQSKIDGFLGMKFSSDEKERTKLVSSAYMGAKEMTEALKDPEFYNQVCLLKKYGKQFKANIENRTNGKAKVLDKLPKTPSVSQGIRTFQSNNSSMPKKFDGKSFLGR